MDVPIVYLTSEENIVNNDYTIGSNSQGGNSGKELANDLHLDVRAISSVRDLSLKKKIKVLIFKLWKTFDHDNEIKSISQISVHIYISIN